MIFSPDLEQVSASFAENSADTWLQTQVFVVPIFARESLLHGNHLVSPISNFLEYKMGNHGTHGKTDPRGVTFTQSVEAA